MENSSQSVKVLKLFFGWREGAAHLRYPHIVKFCLSDFIHHISARVKLLLLLCNVYTGGGTKGFIVLLSDWERGS